MGKGCHVTEDFFTKFKAEKLLSILKYLCFSYLEHCH